MKKYISLLTILVSIAGWSGNGFCQTPILGCPQNNLGITSGVCILSYKNSPILANGTYFAVGIYSENPTGLMNGLERIYAQNTDPDIDGHVYEFGLTPSIRNMMGEFGVLKKFEGQYGMYEVTIERSESVLPYLETPFTCYTDPIDDNLIPLPVPKNLKVSFKSGATTPTLSFDPVGGFPSGLGEWYHIRIYDKDYTRRIYNVMICTADARCSKKDLDPSVTFPDSRAVSSGQTYEDLVPGEEYIFRADLIKLLPSGPRIRNYIQAINFKSFKVPKK